MDLAQAFNAPVDVPFGGRTFTLRQLTLAEWAPLQAWLKRACPSPVTQALKAVQEAHDLGLPLAPGTRDALFAHAQEQARGWPPAFGGRAWLKAVGEAPGGEAEFVRHCLAACGADLPAAEVARLVEAATRYEVDEFLRVVYYGDPPAPPDPEAAGPKAGAGATPLPAVETAA